MPRIPPVSEADARDKVAETYGRVREMLGTDRIPGPFLVYGNVEAFLRDFYMNFKKFVHGAGKLDEKGRAVVGLAVSANAACGMWYEFFADRLRALGSMEGELHDIVAVASTNAMYNTFFKFRDIAGSDLFEGLPVGLRAHTFSGTSLDDQTVELINIVISDLNACKPCVAGHVKKARDLGVADEAILEAVQCAATLQSGIRFLEAAGC
ncbi:MAG: carboxymuconolactone decarboxylase family protein [Planctomycetales bacterium]